jgi:hypothetical protein
MRSILTSLTLFMLFVVFSPAFFGSKSAGTVTDCPGGVVVLLGIDAEDRFATGHHGPASVYAAIVSHTLLQVTNGGSGILVIGAGKSAADDATGFWSAVAAATGQPATFINGASQIAAQPFGGFALVVVVSDAGDTSGGLTEEENDALAARAADVATFVEGGGGLFGLSSNFANPYPYASPFGAFAFHTHIPGNTGVGYDHIIPTDMGLAFGLTDALNVCCWHDEFSTFPPSFQLLATNFYTGQAAAIAGTGVKRPAPTIPVVTCPPDQTVSTGPFDCGAPLNYPAPAGNAPCMTVNCVPPPGSVVGLGVTTVTCTAAGAPSCSFTVKVVDATGPALTCPDNLTRTLSPGQTRMNVYYSPAGVADNCGGATAFCSPPSGTSFPVGESVVTCTGTDAAGNQTACSFTVSVKDQEPPTIQCPADVTVEPPPGQCADVVSFPSPVVTDNLPGLTVIISPPSGSTFPSGTTTVTVTATDAAGNRAACSFTVTVNCRPVVSIAGGKAALEFSGAQPVRKEKPPGPDCHCEDGFTITNPGSGDLVLTLDSISRVGDQVNDGVITEPDDRKFLSVRLANADGPAVTLERGSRVVIPGGQRQDFIVILTPLIPAAAGTSRGLAASAVLPDLLTSEVVFRNAAMDRIAINVIARIDSAVRIINADNPRRAGGQVRLARTADGLEVTFGVFDANLDVTRARYEFLDAGGSAIGQAIEIDLAGSIAAGRITKGQSFTVTQRFTGGSTRRVTAVRVTVFDSQSSSTGEAQL